MANEIQRLDVSGITAGDLSIQGPDSAASQIAIDTGAGGINLDDLKSAMAEAWAYTSADFDATDNGNSTYDIEFINDRAGSNQPEATVAFFSGTGTPFFTTLQEGGASTAKAVLFHNHYQQQGIQ